MTRLTWYQPYPCQLHRPLPRFPESSRRLIALQGVRERLGIQISPSLSATHNEVRLAHAPEYIREIERLSRIESFSRRFCSSLASPYLQCYTTPSRGTYLAALDAVGAVLMGTAHALNDRSHRAFCAVRPPGHHAGYAYGEGFCFFNNVAIGALHIHAQGARVASIDFDRHHGNGTEHIIAHANSDRLFFASSYQAGCSYAQKPQPTGTASHIHRFPIAHGSTGHEVLTLYGDRIIPELIRFQPDVILISAGFDLHQDDALYGLKVKMSTVHYAVLTDMIVRAAVQCNAGIVSVLEGGYNPKALADSVYHHVRALMR